MAMAVDDVLDERISALRPALIRFAMHLSKDQTQAEDYVQEAFCRAFGRHDLDIDRLAGWLRTVVTNVARDAWRRHHRTLQWQALGHSGSVPDHADDIIDLEMARSAAAAAAGLPTIQRDVLFAVADGESVRDIAARVGLSVRAVEGHLRRARQTVRRWAAA